MATLHYQDWYLRIGDEVKIVGLRRELKPVLYKTLIVTRINRETGTIRVSPPSDGSPFTVEFELTHQEYEPVTYRDEKDLDLVTRIKMVQRSVFSGYLIGQWRNTGKDNESMRIWLASHANNKVGFYLDELISNLEYPSHRIYVDADGYICFKDTVNMDPGILWTLHWKSWEAYPNVSGKAGSYLLYASRDYTFPTDDDFANAAEEYERWLQNNGR